MHPHHLHATRAATTLATTRRHLDQAVDDEYLDRRQEARTIAAAASLQAWRPIPGPSGKGGHGDPSGRSAVDQLEPEVRAGRLARLAASTTATLTWLTTALSITITGDPLPALTAAIPILRPATSRELTLWLDEADQQIRDRLGLDPAGVDLPRVRCPRCARRALTAHTLGSRHTWTIVCTTNCVCLGPTCPCQMPIRTIGVRHVWGPDHPLVASLTTAA
ncbi:hypothetical protein GA0070616_4378 [Micromonospora nigra]|uniref:Uncharacterized protein n=1 Tax=Micromonospora nigra TaxID=145857 RepID=A0A1C6SRG9_9ACTN|nr:hypothetical protein [Micromonospora nigra]SCL32040.1 hypothetical protein GA0070616_4378 [Micromonospora nigra]